MWCPQFGPAFVFTCEGGVGQQVTLTSSSFSSSFSSAARLYAQFLVSLDFNTAFFPAEKSPAFRITQSQSRVEA